MSKEAELDERFSFGPPLVKTPEDAVMAFLRKEITEDEFRAACARYGVEPGTLFNAHSGKVERVDAAYEQTIPDDIYNPVANPDDNVQARLDAVKEKEKAKAEANKEIKENEKLPPAQELTTKK